MDDPRSAWLSQNSGGGGIRTHGTLSGPPVFETAPFGRSGTPPRGSQRSGERSAEPAGPQYETEKEGFEPSMEAFTPITP